MAKGTIADLVVQMRADLGQLRFDLQNVEKTFQSSFAKIKTDAVSLGKTLAGAFGIGLSAAAVVGFGKSVVALGDKLSDLSDQTRLSINLLGGLRNAADQNGSSVESLAAIILKAQSNLGQMEEGGQGAARTLKNLGLSVTDLQKMSPDEFFKTIAKTLAGVTSQTERAAIAAQIFGKAGAQANAAILAWVNGGMKELDDTTAKAYKRLGELKDQAVVTGNKFYDFAARGVAQLIKNLEELGDMMGTVAAQMRHLQRGAATGGVEGLLPEKPFKGFAVDNKAAQDALRSFIDGLKKQADTLKVNIVELGGGALAAKELGLAFEFAALKARLLAEGKALPAGAKEQFEAARKEIVAQTVAFAQQKELVERLAQDEADRLGLAKELADAELAPFKLQDAATMREFAEAEERATRDFDDLAEAAREWAQIPVTLARADDALTESLQRISKEAKILGPDFDELGARIGAIQERLRTLAEGSEWDELKRQLEGLVAQKQLRDDLRDITDAFTDGIRETVIGIQRGDQSLGEGLRNGFRNALLGVNAAILDKTIFEPIKASINAFFDGFVSAFGLAGDSAAKQIAKNLGASLGNWLSNILGGGGGFNFLSLFGGTAALAESTGFELGGSFASVPFLEKGGPIPRFQSGGKVTAILDEGEFVMTKAATDAIGTPKLNYANKNLKLPEFRYGGHVSMAPFTIPHFDTGGPVGQWSNGNMAKIGGDTYNIDARGSQRGTAREWFRELQKSENRAVLRAVTAVGDERRRSNNYARIFGR
jgi:hypothetical protein